MLRVVAHKSAAAARQYYAEGLKREDYYTEKQEVVGNWHGLAAERMGLSGNVTSEAFAALVENRHPVDGGRLTPHTKSDRIVGYDLNFHAPKSLSVLYAMTLDKNVLKAFRQAVQETMTEIEQNTATRVRKRGDSSNRVTGNLAWAEFVHFTARPVGGIPDPHLHVHCFAFNATFDGEEGRWKAAKFRDIKRNAPYSEAAFHSRLAVALAGQGYAIQRTKQGWEIKGMPSSVLAKFSRRTAQIERLAHEKGITDPKEKETLGALTREGKRHGLTFSDLMAAWSVRLTEDEKVTISKVCYDKDQPRGARVTASEAVDYALAKLFEKQSVVERGRILAEAMRYGIGNTTPQAIKSEFERRGLIGRLVGEEHLCTTMEVLAEEVALINFARAGRNSAMPLGGRSKLNLGVMLSDEQRAAVKHILTTRDQVIAIRGGAGVGKTTLMKEAVAAIEARGVKVYAFAPSASASRETMREAGFEGAETVAHLLTNTKLQKQIRGQVIWIDEAGLLGVRDMWRIMEIAGNGTRVILTGDTAQHAPVARGDAFRLLQQHAGLRVAEVTQIRRQELEDYKQAIEALSKGDLRTGFRRLDKLEAFVEIADEAERYRQLAADFLALSKHGDVPLVVSPTHAESAKVTEAIRSAKRDAKSLGAERQFIQYHNLQWEEAARALPENYSPGLVIQYHQNAKGVKRGEILRVLGHDASGAVQVSLENGGTGVLSIKDAPKFQVFEQREIPLGKGDRIRITRNGQTADGRRLNNGNVFTVEKFDKRGRIILNTGAILDKDHGHFAYGYCQTSHSSQSKSVQHVLVAQSEASFVASSREQFYVSCSRGKETIRIYTDNRRGLQEAVGNSSIRMAGVELAELNQKEISSMSTELGSKQWRDAIQSRRGLDESKSWVQTVARQRQQDPLKKGTGANWRGYIEMRRNLAGPDGKSRAKGHPMSKKKGGQPRGRTLPKTSLHTTPFREKMLALHEAKKGAEEKALAAPDKDKALPEKPTEARKVEQPAKASPEPSKGATDSKRQQASLKQQAAVEAPKVGDKKPTPEQQKTAPQQTNVRKNWAANMYQTATTHFNKLADKVKGQGKEQQAVKTQGQQVAQTQQPKPAQGAERQVKMGNAQVKPLQQNNTAQIAEHAAKQKPVDAGVAAQKQAALQQKIQAQQMPPPPPPRPKK
jgi:conjugative relaxase-like TrwC/TraI family protein